MSLMEKKTAKVFTSGQPLSAYLNETFSCTCGRTHYAPLQQVIIGAGVLEQLADILTDRGFCHPFLVSDEITYRVAGEKCAAVLERASIPYKIVQLQHTGFDEATLGELLLQMPKACDVCIAVGAGSINDITRLFSYKMGVPFITVATAASMDGFASGVAAIHAEGIKVTVEGQTPLVIVGDTDILRNTPYKMIAAGLGDLLGKITCLCDWKLSKSINSEHYCEQTAELIGSCARDVLKNAEKAKDRDEKIVGHIMEGLVLAGVAMSLYGNSRPASGCEHHISHYWEMLFPQKEISPSLHGTQVGIGTVLILKLAEKFLGMSVAFDAARSAALRYDPRCWEQQIRSAYGTAAEGIIRIEEAEKKNETSLRLVRIARIEENWAEICSILAELPPADAVAKILQGLGAPCMPNEIGVDAVLLRDTLLYCKEVRSRYTFLQMLWDLDLLDTLVEEIVEELYGSKVER